MVQNQNVQLLKELYQASHMGIEAANLVTPKAVSYTHLDVYKRQQ